MHGFRDIAHRRAHLDRENALADDIACSDTRYADPENSFRLGFDDELGQTVRPVQCECPPRGAPGKFSHLNFDVVGFGFGFRQATPGHLRIRIDDRRNDDVLEGAFFAEHRLDRNASLF